MTLPTFTIVIGRSGRRGVPRWSGSRAPAGAGQRVRDNGRGAAVTGRFLQIVVCGAGPAGDVTRLISIAQGKGWSAAVIATAAALDFLDAERVEELSGYPIRRTLSRNGSGNSGAVDRRADSSA